jgi:hypothetical protein
VLRATWKVTRLWIHMDAWVRRHTPFALGRYPFKQLERLAFIHFAHWSLIDRIPPNAKNARRLDHPYMLFQTNFNRGWREYVEGFCLIIPTAMRLNWRWMYGFPSPKPVGRFIKYVESRFSEDAHFYCAYPDSSTRMVIAAIDARQKFDMFAGEAIGPPARFLPQARRAAGPVLLGGWRGDETDTLSVIAPVLEGYEGRLNRVLRSLPKDVDSPLARVAGTHMARWTVVTPLPHKKAARPKDPTWYLLFTAWFDGDTDVYIRALRSGLRNRADEIWGKCADYPGWRDLTAFGSYMERHSITPRLAFAGYSQRVRDIRAGLELRDRLAPTVIRESGMDSVALEHAWIDRRRAGLR